MTNQEIADLVTGFRSHQWSWSSDDIHRQAHDFGWKVENKRARSARMGTRFGMATGSADFNKNGEAERISVDACSSVDPDDHDGQSWLQDVFVKVVEAVATVLGEPTDRLPGETPELRWRGDQCTFVVTRLQVVVRLASAKNEFVDKSDRMKQDT